MLVRVLPLVVAAVCSVATASRSARAAGPTARRGVHPPDRRGRRSRRPRRRARRAAGRPGAHLRQRRTAGDAVPRPDLGGDRDPRRARPARHGVPARCRRHRARLRQLHQPHRRRQHRGRPLHPQRRRSAGRRHGVTLRPDVAGDRRGATALHHPAVRQPQRRQPGVRPRRLPVHRHGRWRGRRRPRQPRADADQPARQDAAHRRRRQPDQRLPHPARQPRLHDGQSAHHQRVAGNLVVRPAQPLALQLRRRRPRRHRRPRDRRRRPERPRGDQLRAGGARRQQLRLERLRGADREPGDRRTDAGLPAGDRAGLRLPPHLRQCDYRRLRLSRHPARRLLPGTLLLRRLRLGPHLVAGADDRFVGRRRGLGQPRSHGGARRAVPLHHLVCPRRRRRALLHGLRWQQPDRQRPRLRARGRSRDGGPRHADQPGGERRRQQRDAVVERAGQRRGADRVRPAGRLYPRRRRDRRDSGRLERPVVRQRAQRAVLRAGAGRERRRRQRADQRSGGHGRLHGGACRPSRLHDDGQRRRGHAALERRARHGADGARGRLRTGHHRIHLPVCGASRRDRGECAAGNLLRARPGGEQLRAERAVGGTHGGRSQ